jgi:hypothetical protein
MKKPIFLFAIIYFFLEVGTIFIIFGWNAFGGANSMNFFQKAVTFFFTFPSKVLFTNNSNILQYVIPNTISWTAIFSLGLILWRKIRYQGRALR